MSIAIAPLTDCCRLAIKTGNNRRYCIKWYVKHNWNIYIRIGWNTFSNITGL